MDDQERVGNEERIGDEEQPRVIWIGYTFHYREGGPKIKRVAETMAREKRAAEPEARVILQELNSKREFIDAMEAIPAGTLKELQFIGHSGMYGPMFGTTSLPEQFSPHEWRSMTIPFDPSGAEAYFHACRTGRWFAAFFAQTFRVPAHGYHWYTTFSRDPVVFRWEGLSDQAEEAPLYMRGCAGKKSHGVWAGLKKYVGRVSLEQPKRFEPMLSVEDSSYDPVAELYAEVFEDITVRRDEWRWVSSHLDGLGSELSVLDIGCGNGALLDALSNRLTRGEGVDASQQMIEHAQARHVDQEHLSLTHIDGPSLPFEDDQFDVVISFLSFRYLDWDPLMREVVRVLKPGGRILVVDMVTAPLRFTEVLLLLRSKWTYARVKREHPVFYERLQRLVSTPEWRQMLRYNPIRAEHEMRWYLESRFSGQRVEVINVGWHNRVLAFDSGPIWSDYVAPQSYP